MSTAWFENAPPPIRVGVDRAVPMHIQDLRARVTMDGATSTNTVEATMIYTVGPTAGRPFFDLRQSVDRCELDGVEIDPARIAAHDFGAGPWSTLRVIDTEQAAGSAHRLSLTYRLATPNADLGGTYPPVLRWSAGPRLRWSFGMSDLFAGRYLEAWFPSNLPFDQFPFTLELRITGTPISHALITNGSATVVGTQSWSISFPRWFTTMSPLVEIHPSDEVVLKTSTLTLAMSRRKITIEAWKHAADIENLSARVAEVERLLSDYAQQYGEFLGTKFVCFLHRAAGGMEYSGATTTSGGALRHEVFHSWFARGVSPAAQSDGWWDEALAQYHTDGIDRTEPFDFTKSPVTLCSRQPFQRTTPKSAYTKGSRFFRGVGARVGAAEVQIVMRDLYRARRATPVTTAMLEEHIVGSTGAVDLIDGFHRFVYGFDEPVPDPWIAFAWGMNLWVRNTDDGSTVDTGPKAGQDNWIRARVRNRPDAGTCRHFLVTFAIRPIAARPFTYPQDFFPALAVAGFDLEPGTTRTVSCRWPRNVVPAPGTALSLLASVHARRSHPASGTHVWEQASTAQRNMTVT